MKKTNLTKRLLLFLTALVCFNLGWGQTTSQFIHKYPSAKVLNSSSKIKKINSSYILIDSEKSDNISLSPNPYAKLCFIGLNSNLSVNNLISKKLKQLQVYGEDILPIDDNFDGIEDAFIICGSLVDTISNNTNRLYLAKFNLAGNKLWEKIFMDQNNNVHYSGSTLTKGLNNDSAFYVAGKSGFPGNLHNQLFLMKINSNNGGIIEQNLLSNSIVGENFRYPIVLTDSVNNQVIVTGSESNKPFIYKFDSNCNLINTSIYNIPYGVEVIENAILSSDNYLYMVGSCFDYTPNSGYDMKPDQFITKIDLQDNSVIWSKTFDAMHSLNALNNFEEKLSAIFELDNGNLACVGTILVTEEVNSLPVLVDKNLILMEISPMGILTFGRVWEMPYLTTINKSYDDLIVEQNQDFVISSTVDTAFYILKAGPDGKPLTDSCANYFSYTNGNIKTVNITTREYIYNNPIISNNISTLYKNKDTVFRECELLCDITFDINNPSVNCDYQFPLTLSSLSSSGLSIVWYNAAGQVIGSGTTCVVNHPGFYYAIASSTTNNCSKYDEVIIADKFSVTSLNDNTQHKGNDIVSDNLGNIYVTGYFNNTSTFKTSGSNFIATNPNATKSFYVAKYDVCGNLVWINYSTKGTSLGKAIALDKNRGILYVAGEYAASASAGIKLFSQGVIPPGSPLPSTVNYGVNTAGSSFVLAINMNNGAPLANAFNESLLSNVKINAIEAIYNAGNNSSDVYIGGYQIVTSTTEKTYLKKFRYTTLFNSSTVLTSTSTNPQARINDISATGTRIVATGHFTNLATPASPNFSLSASSFLNTLGVQEAFKFEYNTTLGGAIGTLVNLVKLGASAGKTASGTGIVIDPTGVIYVTGNYTGNITSGASNGFGTGYTLNGSTYNSVFVYRLTNGMPNGFDGGNKYYSSNGNAFSTGITADNNNIYLCGYWQRGTLTSELYNPDDLTFQSAAYSGVPSSKRIFVTSWDINTANQYGYIDPNWMNATKDAGAGNHIPTRIASNGNFTFLTGSYIGSLSHNAGTPTFSTITSTPGAESMCILRNKVTNGEFRNAQEASADENENTEILLDSDSKFEIKVYPNPSKGEFNLSINSADSDLVNVSIYDVTGRMIIKQSLNNGIHNFNLSDYPKGIYLMVIQGKEKANTHKVIIE